MRASLRHVVLLLVLVPVFSASGCADEPPIDASEEDTGADLGTEDQGSLDVRERPDIELEVYDDASDDSGSDASDVTGQPDTGGEDLTMRDEPDLVDEPDAPIEGDLATCADDDGDGFLAETCGGRDCNDDDRFVHPDAREFCDTLDNNCDGNLNEGVECTFLAHTPTELVRVDPFALTTEVVASAPDLWDMDTHPDGTVYAISQDALYRLDQESFEWIEITEEISAPGDTNGMAIDLAGTAFLTSGNRLYELDLETGEADSIGRMGPGFESSGDVVVNKGGSLFMSSRDGGRTDYLVLIDASNGRARTVGAIGFNKVYGLTAAWGYLFGLTARGEILAIDSETGEGELLATFPDLFFGGSASAAER